MCMYVYECWYIVYGISYGFVLSKSNFQVRINQLTHREFLKALHVVLCYEIRIICFLLKTCKTLKNNHNSLANMLFDILAGVGQIVFSIPLFLNTEPNNFILKMHYFSRLHAFLQYILCNYFSACIWPLNFSL